MFEGCFYRGLLVYGRNDLFFVGFVVLCGFVCVYYGYVLYWWNGDYDGKIWFDRIIVFCVGV